ncbi:MAG: N-acetylmuramoyl-L-alanine amidase [Chloroflexi bacterium]|nr:N-acetylmuramoyl-L-alanine amidase [Chloroflexota bacterium]
MLAALFAALVLLGHPFEPVDVALDPGHSRADVGAAGGGLREYQLTLDLAQRMRTRLQDAHLSVRLTRTDDQPLTAYTNPNLTDQIQAEQEARIAAAGPARVYVSLHFNGGPANLRGTETYFNPFCRTPARRRCCAMTPPWTRWPMAALRVFWSTWPSRLPSRTDDPARTARADAA